MIINASSKKIATCVRERENREREREREKENNGEYLISLRYQFVSRVHRVNKGELFFPFIWVLTKW